MHLAWMVVETCLSAGLRTAVRSADLVKVGLWRGGEQCIAGSSVKFTTEFCTSLLVTLSMPASTKCTDSWLSCVEVSCNGVSSQKCFPDDCLCANSD